MIRWFDIDLTEISYRDRLWLIVSFEKLWRQYCSTDNQLEKKLDHFERRAADLLKVPIGQVTLNALQHNIAVATLFIEAWLRG